MSLRASVALVGAFAFGVALVAGNTVGAVVVLVLYVAWTVIRDARPDRGRNRP
jgi:hypothetical protein